MSGVTAYVFSTRTEDVQAAKAADIARLGNYSLSCIFCMHHAVRKDISQHCVKGLFTCSRLSIQIRRPINGLVFIETYLFHSQPPILPEDTHARFYLSTTFGLRFMIGFVSRGHFHVYLTCRFSAYHFSA